MRKQQARSSKRLASIEAMPRNKNMIDKHRMSREDLLIAENSHGNSQRKKITRSTSYEMNMNNFN